MALQDLVGTPKFQVYRTARGTAIPTKRPRDAVICMDKDDDRRGRNSRRTTQNLFSSSLVHLPRTAPFGTNELQTGHQSPPLSFQTQGQSRRQGSVPQSGYFQSQTQNPLRRRSAYHRFRRAVVSKARCDNVWENLTKYFDDIPVGWFASKRRRAHMQYLSSLKAGDELQSSKKQLKSRPANPAKKRDRSRGILPMPPTAYAREQEEHSWRHKDRRRRRPSSYLEDC
ncbi:hypothetical protein BGY98DRAFT_938259 [Russula aff. rugulosa BPL654]|nr:hypothetical protein BGY98DRAFT_938259 [Russula aff. rugulosa BPL654]